MKRKQRGPKLGEEMGTKAIAGRLQALRDALGWTQVMMCERTGIGATTYNNYERAVGPIPFHSALKICAVTGASLDWIYRGERGLMPVKLMEAIEGGAAQRA